MARRCAFFLALMGVVTLNAYSQVRAPLKLMQVIPISKVKSRFDHFGIDLKDLRLFVPAEQAKAVEVFDLRKGRLSYALSGFAKPHGIYYRPESDELFVSDDDGTVKVFRAAGGSYSLVKTVKLTLSRAGAMRYDPAGQRLYVGNYRRSESDSGSDYVLLGIIDARTDRHVGDIRLRGRIMKAFAIERTGPRIFVAIKDRDEVAVVNRRRGIETAEWRLHGADFPYAVTLDEAHHRLFVVTRKPGMLLVLDSDSGRQIASLPAPAGVDDAYYDKAHQRIYVSAGVGSSPEGYIAVYKQLDADHYRPIATILTGAASATSLLVPQLNRYYVVAQRNGARDAEVRVYQVEP
ncbi:MAG TPA: hypothetical protein VKV79_06280 [Terriglobia bacterium]|nr:hypothetical protein [Terriglobia bacterium]